MVEITTFGEVQGAKMRDRIHEASGEELQNENTWTGPNELCSQGVSMQLFLRLATRTAGGLFPVLVRGKSWILDYRPL